MPKSRKVFVIGGNLEYANWMEATSLVSRLEDADLVIATGGEDICPARYREPIHPRTCYSTERDDQEWPQFERARKLGIPLVGVCRGSQAMSVFAGGKLVQHQDNPSYLHQMDTEDGQKLVVSSTHHQAAHPWNLPPDQFRVIGWSTHISAFHEDGNGEEMVDGIVPGDRECEIVYYPKTRALGIQSHPEHLYGEPGHESMIAYMRSLLNRHLAGTL